MLVTIRNYILVFEKPLFFIQPRWYFKIAIMFRRILMRWFKKLFGIQDDNNQSYIEEDIVVDEFNSEQSQISEADSVDGFHYIDYVEQIKKLKKEKKHQEAIYLLLKLVDATESESKEAGKGWGVAPWYYEQLAIIYRKEKRYADEIAILERYMVQEKAPGAGAAKLAERLIKVKGLVLQQPIVANY